MCLNITPQEFHLRRGTVPDDVPRTWKKMAMAFENTWETWKWCGHHRIFHPEIWWSILLGRCVGDDYVCFPLSYVDGDSWWIYQQYHNRYGGFLKWGYLWIPPVIIHFNGIFHLTNQLWGTISGPRICPTHLTPLSAVQRVTRASKASLVRSKMGFTSDSSCGPAVLKMPNWELCKMTHRW